LHQLEQKMSNMEKEIPENTIEQTIKVLEYLNTCEPLKAKARRTKLEVNADRLTNLFLGFGAGGIALAGCMAYWHSSIKSLPMWGKDLALVLIFTSTVSVLLSFLTPIVAQICILTRWKTISLKNMIDDIRHENTVVDSLQHHAISVLQEAKYWLQLKITRAEARVAYFFGEKTAGLALLGTAYVCAKEFGGFPWLGKTLEAGFVLGNWGNTALLMIIAMVLGLSLGALLLKQVSARYRFQVELIEHVLSRQCKKSEV